MAMTKAQLEAWLEGWRLVEAVQRVEKRNISKQQAMVQMLEICEFSRQIAPAQAPTSDPQSWLVDPWVRLRVLASNA